MPGLACALPLDQPDHGIQQPYHITVVVYEA